jgi:copper chaperone CopZ
MNRMQSLKEHLDALYATFNRKEHDMKSPKGADLFLFSLWVLLLLPACGGESEKAEPSIQISEEIGLIIEGMTCENCVNTVTRVLSRCEGVAEVHVSLEEGRADLGGDGMNVEILSKAVEGAGYKVKGVEGPAPAQ